LQPLPQCANSARDFEHYLRSSLGIPRKNIINLFDSDAAASDQLDQIADWLAQSASVPSHGFPTDLVVYYTGHGGFSRNDQSYFLAVHKTREGSEGATSIRYVDLASCIKRHADSLRKYLILDCCFAAAAVVKTQADISQVVIQRVEDELPPSGTAVLCSSAAKLVSIAPPGERHTMFSGALLECLRVGVPKGPQALTLEDVGKAARMIIQGKYPIDSVRPELHVPEQSRGNPAKVPLFPNLLWRDQSADEQVTGTAAMPALVTEHWLATALRPRNGRMVIGALCGLSSTLACAFLPYPFGLTSTRPVAVLYIAPIAPALFLTGGIIIVLNAFSRLKWRSNALILSATYLAWLAAWMTVYYPMEYLAQVTSNKLQIDLGFVVSSGFAGYIGSFLLSVALAAILQSTGSVDTHTLRTVARTSVAFGLWGAIAAAPTLAGQTKMLSLTFFLGLFLPWQGWYVYVSTTRLINAREDESPTSRQYLFWLAGSAALLLVLMPSAVQTSLNRLAGPPAPLITLNVLTATSVLTKAKERRVTVKYQIKTHISEPLGCDIELRSGGAIYQNPVPPTVLAGAEASSEFTVPTESLDDAEIRLSCSAPNMSYATPWGYWDVQAAN
jgi:hypothetical protein